MDINKILNSDYLDIIFEGRNKVYGGYELRKNYPKRLYRSLLVLVGICLFTAAYSIINMKFKHEAKPVLNMKQVTLAEPPPIDPKKTPPPPPPPPPPPVKPMVKFTPPVIKKDEEVKEEEVPPPQKEITAAGPKDEKGDPNGIDPGIVDKGTGTGVVAAPPPPAIFSYVEQMPSAPYDYQDYLNKHIVYPDAARESNIEGRVIVKFVVNEDGAISDVQVQRGIGGGCDEEAKRVVSSFPKWKPGKQNGKPVKVYFTLPIVFKLQ